MTPVVRLYWAIIPILLPLGRCDLAAELYEPRHSITGYAIAKPIDS